MLNSENDVVNDDNVVDDTSKKEEIEVSTSEVEELEDVVTIEEVIEPSKDEVSPLIDYLSSEILEVKTYTYDELHTLVNNEKNIDKNKNSSNLSKTPIFIVGMPRSGTTLVEQIISSHPDVFGGDELNELPTLINDNLLKNKDEDISIDNFIYDKNKLLGVARKYIDYLKNLSNNSKKVTDKLPINFKWIGLIKMILPNSTVIHCIRNPRDNCLSIFKNYFVNTKLNFAYNLEEICGFYNLYSDLMTYWKNTLPKFVFDIKYEKIIDNPEHEIRNLLKVCNLSWNDNCLKFYNNKRPIKTVSNVQARKKIYKSSIDSWKNYEKYLGKFFK